MPRTTKVVIECVLPTTSMSRIGDYINEVFGVAQKHVGDNVFTTITGPYPEGHFTRGSHGEQGSDEHSGGERLGRGRGGEDRDDSGSNDGPAPGNGGSTGSGNDGEPVKRGRGRPRKETGTPAEGPQRDRDDERTEDRGSREGSGRNEPQRTREGSGQSSGEGTSRDGSDHGRGSSDRGNREAPRVKPDPDDDWGDEPSVIEDEGEEFHAKTPGDTEWPNSLMPEGEIDKAAITALLGDHFKAAGGKSKDPTYDLMEKITGERAIRDVPEKQYDDLARGLLKDIARYKYGIKKPAK